MSWQEPDWVWALGAEDNTEIWMCYGGKQGLHETVWSRGRGRLNLVKTED